MTVFLQKTPLTNLVSQKAILSKYAKENHFSNPQFFVDDGYFGANFERPSWSELVKKIENGEVATLIVKDMSRLGRDYLRAGLYPDVLFPEKGVRFITISNGVDSANQQENDFTPFLNIINEWYCRDTSKKIRAVMKYKSEAGEHLCTNQPYGYMKDADNPKEKQLVFEDTHETIIDADTWKRMQELRKNKRRPTRTGKINMFSGIVRYADCGEKLYYSQAKTLKRGKTILFAPLQG